MLCRFSPLAAALITAVEIADTIVSCCRFVSRRRFSRARLEIGKSMDPVVSSIGSAEGCHLSAPRGLKDLYLSWLCSFWQRVISPTRERMTSGEHSVVVKHAS